MREWVVDKWREEEMQHSTLLAEDAYLKLVRTLVAEKGDEIGGLPEGFVQAVATTARAAN